MEIAARNDRVTKALSLLAGGGLIDTEQALDELGYLIDDHTARTRECLEENLAAVDMAVPLLRTLRAGIPAEICWPALDAALADLGEPQGVTSTWPVLTVFGTDRVIAVGPSGRVADATFTLPARAHDLTVFFAGGDFLVGYSEHPAGQARSAFWLSAPGDVFEPAEQAGMTRRHGSSEERLGYQFGTGDGGRYDGERVLRAGDRHGVGQHRPQVGDGARVWGLRWEGTAGDRWAELDPVTGASGESLGLPAFLADVEIPPDCIRPNSLISSARLPDGHTDTPLGQVDGLTAYRITRDRDYRAGIGYLVEGIDGRGAHVKPHRQFMPWGVFEMPAGGARLLMTCHDDRRSLTAYLDGAAHWEVGSLPDEQTATLNYQRIQWKHHPDDPRPFPPPAFWHFLGARDIESSRALRALDLEQVRRLLTDGTVPDSITDPLIAEAVRSFGSFAARLAQQLERTIHRVNVVRADLLARPPVAIADTELYPALLGLLPDLGYATEKPAALATLAADGSFFAGDIDRYVRSLSCLGRPVAWTPLLGHIDAIVWRAVTARTPQPQRAALLGLLHTWAAQPYARPGEWRSGRARSIPDDRTIGYGETFLQPATAPAPDQATDIRSIVLTRDDSVRLPRIAELLETHGPIAVSERAVRIFAERTGVRDAVARLVLDGLPRRDGHGFDRAMSPHEKMLRAKPYGMTEAMARDYETLIGRLGAEGTVRLLAAAVPDDPAELWTVHADLAAAERLATAWNELIGRRSHIPEEVMAALEAATGLDRPFALALLCPAVSPMATEDLHHVLRTEYAGKLRVTGSRGTDALSGRDNPYRSLATALVWALTERPVGDSVAAHAVDIYERLRARLSAPNLLVSLGFRHFRAAVFGPGTVPVPPHDLPVHDNGLVIVNPTERFDYIFLRPAALSDPALVERTARLCAANDMPDIAHAIYCEQILVTGLARLVERAVTTPVGAGHYEADPRHSVPDLVGKISADTGASPDASALYLQLLTLARPTDRNIRSWNGWKAAHHKTVQAELATLGLIEIGKRPRAGRTAFIPGPWTDRVAAPHLPLESGKLDTHLAKPAGKDIEGPYLRIFPPAPLHEMFAEAWAASADRRPGLET
ncbi:hypothetical protein [Nocardia sp. NPDC003345]